MRCPSCAASLSEGSRGCPACGAASDRAALEVEDTRRSGERTDRAPPPRLFTQTTDPDLATLLRRIGRLPDDRAIRAARQLCAGVGAAHAEAVLHRAPKPANVMIDGRGDVKITDFGIAGAADEIQASGGVQPGH